MCVYKYAHLKVRYMKYKKYKNILIYVIVALIGFIFTYYKIIDISKVNDIFIQSDQYQPIYNKQNITEYVFIYVGSSKCIYSNGYEFYKFVRDVKYQLYKRLTDNNLGFHTIGISAEADPNAGINHLRNFGNFNEFISGSGWNNSGVTKYILEYSQDYATPSILITKREYTDDNFKYVKSEDLIYSVSGKNRIVEWIQNGANFTIE